MRDATNVFGAAYDGNYIGGLGYQRYCWSSGHFHLGFEMGVAGRGDDGYSVEFWGGPTLRYEGIVLAGQLRITPSFTAGFSAVTEAMAIERHRERVYDGDATLLFYLGPEIAISTTAHPNVELFYRLHHRSGGDGTLGGLREGYNANVLGLRFRY
jgi:hypothetical protein